MHILLFHNVPGGSALEQWYIISQAWTSKHSRACFSQMPPLCIPSKTAWCASLSGYYCWESVRQSLRVIQCTSCRCTIAFVPLNNKLNLPQVLAISCSETYHHLTCVTPQSACRNPELVMQTWDSYLKFLMKWRFQFFPPFSNKSISIFMKEWVCRQVVDREAQQRHLCLQFLLKLLCRR